GPAAAGEHALLREHGDAGPGAAAGAAGGGGRGAAPPAAARRQQGVAGRHPADAGGAAAVLVDTNLIRLSLVPCPLSLAREQGTRDKGQGTIPAVRVPVGPGESVVLLPPPHPAARTRRSPLRRGAPPDARRRPLGRAGAARPGLPRQAAAVLLAGHGQLSTL